MKKKLNLILIFLCIVLGTIYITQRNKDTEYVFNDIEKTSEVINEELYENEDIIIIEISGEVLKPDLYTLKKGAKLKDALEIAGGLTENADKEALDMERELENKEKINILAKSIDKNDISYQNNTKLININTADKETLMTLPKIGNKIAENIIKYREANGGFKNISEIKNVDLIGEKTFEQIKNLITV